MRRAAQRKTLPESDLLVPLKLEPGGVYVIECADLLSEQGLEHLREQLEAEAAKIGVRFLLLSRGLSIAREREQP